MLLSSLILTLGLELSMFPFSTLQLYEPVRSMQDAPSFSVRYSTELLVNKHIFLRGYIDIGEDPSMIRRFTLTTGQYSVSAGFLMGPLEVGYEHLCFHPLLTYIPLHPDTHVLYEGAIERVYVKATLKETLW